MARRPVWCGLLARVARVFALLVVLLVGVVTFFVHRGQAAQTEALLGFGAQMLQYDDPIHQDRPRSLSINGHTLHLMSGTVEHPVDRVLDTYEERCRKRDGQFFGQLKALTKRYPIITQFEPRAFDGTLRGHGSADGFVACLDMGSDAVGLEDFQDRLNAFQERGDVSEVGRPRFVYAKETKLNSGHKGTHFVAIWTEGSLPLTEMFPVRGDAPGQDVAGVPRPPGSRRIFSFQESGVAQRVTMFSGASIGQSGLRTFYERKLPQRGWRLLVPKQPWLRGPDSFLAARKGNEVVMLSFDEDEHGAGVATVMSEAPLHD